jgi:isocitrate lyase
MRTTSSTRSARVTGNQAMQQVRAGLKAIYLSGWQVAADANTASAMYPDQSLYPANAAPELVKRINRTCSAPTRSRRKARAYPSTPGSRRSSPMRKPASAARSTPSRS